MCTLMLREEDMIVKELMTLNPVTTAPGETLTRAQIKMKAGGFRRLPVIHEGKLIGILSEYDLRPYLESLDTTVGARSNDA